MDKPERFDVESHIPSLRRYARALTRDDACADDLVQEALLRAIERAATFRPGGSLQAWLAGILHNEFVDSLRRRATEARRDASLADLQTQLQTAAGGDQEHAVQLARLEVRFHALPEQQRAVLHLIAVEGLSYQETADAIGVPIGTVMSRLSRARAALRQEGSGGRHGLRVVGGEDA